MAGTRWVELRVHGVSGAPPDAILDRPLVHQVAGDDDSRFFRSVDTAGHELPGEEGQVLEAYHWGRFTSGSWRQGLWMLLLPFGVVNAAQFMLPPSGERTSARLWHAVCGALLRLVAITLTLLLTFTAGLVLIDLIAWRWAPGSRQLGTVDAGVVVGGAILLTATVMLLLSRLGRGYGLVGGDKGRTEERYVLRPSAHEPTTPLSRDAFYRGDSDAPTLRHLHLAAALLLVAVMGAWAADADAWADRDLVMVSAVVGLVLVVAFTTLLGDPEGSVSALVAERIWRARIRWHLVARGIAWTAVAAGALLVLASIAAGWGTDRAGRERIEGYDVIANQLLRTGLCGLLLLGLANGLLVLTVRATRARPGDPGWGFRPYARGMTTFLMGCVAAFLAVGLSSALATGVSSALNLSVRTAATADGTTIKVGTTPMLDRVAYAWGLTFALLVVLAVGVGVWLLRRRSRDTERAREMFAHPGASTLPPRWVQPVGRAVGIARVKNLITPLVTVFVVVGLVLGVALALELRDCHGGGDVGTCPTLPGVLDLLSQPKYVVGSDGVVAISNVVALVGAWLLLAVAGGLVVLGRTAVSEQSKRRGVNVVWDVIAFWPHAVHPFAPRPYSMRCVGDLRARIRWHLASIPDDPDGPPRPLVLCGHSQGSLICFATVAALTDDERRRVSLVTFGSQLRVIFPRAFPAYVSYDAIRDVHAELCGAWVNLYRDTDQLAGPVLSWSHSADGDDARSCHLPDAPGGGPDDYDPATGRRLCGADWRLRDPTPHDLDLHTGAVSGLLRHGSYWRDPDWSCALRHVREIPAPPDPSSPPR